MQELRDVLESKDKEFIKMSVDTLLKKNYENIFTPKAQSLSDFFYPITVKVFYLEMGEKDVAVIDYLSNLLSDRFVRVSNLSEGRKRFFEYYYTVTDIIGYDKYGDMALFNAGIGFSFIQRRSEKTKIDKNYFRSVGKSAYYQASKFGTKNQDVFRQLSNHFEFYESGFNILSTEYIFNFPEEYIIDQLIDAAENFNKSRTEDNLIIKLKHGDMYHKNIENKKKMRDIL